MKKKDVLNLIKYHTDENEEGFIHQALLIADDFYDNGDKDLSEYIRMMVQKANVLSPQVDYSTSFMKKSKPAIDPLPLPECIMKDIMGIVRATQNGSGINKFLFSGAPGTGKTETAKHVARILDRELFVVESASLIDSRLGQSPKNIASLFDEIDCFPRPKKALVLFDEFDALAMERNSDRDLKEMGRVTTAVFKGLDGLNEDVLLIATTNMAEGFDKALLRRFDKVIDFSRYTKEDIIEVGLNLYEFYLKKFSFAKRNKKLFEKIISLMDPLLYPGDLKNAIRSAFAFSSPENPYEYLSLLFDALCPKKEKDLDSLHGMGFSLREIEVITGTSKSKVSRDLKGGNA